jgi:hypothetical protein
MSSTLRSTRWFSAEWRAALLGSLASVPVTLGLTILYQSDVSITGGIVLFGAFIAGALATRASARSDVAGFRAGLLGALWVLLVTFPALVRFASEVGVDWLGSPIATVLGGLLFVVFYATAMVFCGVVGSLCGRVGGWVTATVTGRRVATPDA